MLLFVRQTLQRRRFSYIAYEGKPFSALPTLIPVIAQIRGCATGCYTNPETYTIYGFSALLRVLLVIRSLS
ncbi:hypothetical protein CEXT_481081 [Caerostris extrusa]|uniref:Uncharacterized protein n=1 Tax=Caerostris extrusa TaxID=172846 RepID=A0AAV4V4N2_CAEEX|nr:hypothetical protein CEXT_481081 [Caerostris extrusa]